MNGKKIEVDGKTFEALQVILMDEWFACDHHERLKYYDGEGDDKPRAKDLRAAGKIVSKWLAEYKWWLTENGAE